MTDDEKELIKVGAESAFKPFANLMERLFGGAVDQIGGSWEDRLRVNRHIRRLKLLKYLKAAVEGSGCEPQGIPDNIWIPALQEASVQDDETIQEKWANLLANAGDPRQENPVEPMFVGMLKDLRSSEVRFLDMLINKKENSSAYASAIWGPFNFQSVLMVYQEANGLRGQDRGDLTFSLELLERAQILKVESIPQPIKFADTLNRMPPGRIPNQIPVGTTQTYRITALGMRFIRACRPPASDPPTNVDGF